jgi:DNA-binding NarL/FixJ family response regulator
MNGIPVMIHIDPVTFSRLDKIATAKGTSMRGLIEAHLARSTQPKRARTRAEPKQGRVRAHVRLTLEQQAELVNLSRLGWSMHEIANRFGCSVATVGNWRDRLGLTTKRPRCSPAP